MLGGLVQELSRTGLKLSEEQVEILERHVLGYTNKDFQEAMEIVDWYERAYNPEYIELMHKAQVLSCKSVKLASLVGDMGKEYATSHVNRRLGIAKSVVELSENMAVTKANEQALVQHQDIYSQEYRFKAARDRGQAIIRAINHVLERMRQQIADMRQEKFSNQ